MCLADAVVASWSLQQKVADSNPLVVMAIIFSHRIQQIACMIVKLIVAGHT